MSATDIIADVRKWYDLMNMKENRNILWNELFEGKDVKEGTEEFMMGLVNGGIKITYKLYPKENTTEESK